MPIRPSAAAEIRQLVDALGATENVKREAAIARLAVLGPRAVDHLLRVYPTTAALETRLGILRALESSADARVGALAAATLSDPSPPLVSAAISVLRSLLGSADSKTARDALDALVAVVVDRSRQTDCRLAAFDALRELPSSTLDPIRRTLSADPDAELRQRVGHAPAVVAENPDASVWTTAVEGRLPSSPELLKTALGREASGAKLIHLQRLVDQVRAQESREGDAGRREAWRVVRGRSTRCWRRVAAGWRSTICGTACSRRSDCPWRFSRRWKKSATPRVSSRSPRCTMRQPPARIPGGVITWPPRSARSSTAKD